jgi:hypothetical protein
VWAEQKGVQGVEESWVGMYVPGGIRRIGGSWMQLRWDGSAAASGVRAGRCCVCWRAWASVLYGGLALGEVGGALSLRYVLLDGGLERSGIWNWACRWRTRGKGWYACGELAWCC